MDVRTRHNVKERGRGAVPMAFAHGFGCDQTMWRRVAPAFERDHRIVLFDHVGAGRAPASGYDPARHGTLHGYADDLLEIADALDLRDAVLVAHSVSSMIGVIAANRAPQVFTRLVLLAPSPRYVDDPPSYVGGFSEREVHELLSLVERNDHGWTTFLAGAASGGHPDTAAELASSFCAIDPRIARAFAAVTFLSDHRADVARVAQPSLVVQCADDIIAPPAVGRWLAQAMPDATFTELAVRGHCPHLSHPEQTVAAIRAWMRTTDGR